VQNTIESYFIIKRLHNNTFFHFFQLTDDEVTRIYRERNPLERLAQLNSLKQRESSVVRDMILARVGAGSRSSATSTRVAFGVRRPRNAVLASTVPLPPKESDLIPMTPPPQILNSLELQQNFHVKSQSCHQLEQLMDFPLIDADESEMSPAPPTRPARRNAKSPKRSEEIKEKVEVNSNEEEKQPKTRESNKMTNGEEVVTKNISEKNTDQSPKLSPVKKTVSLPATPLTDPEKFGIPVRNATKHQNKNQAARKKLTLNTTTTSSKSSEDNNSLASPVDQMSSTSNEIDNMDGILSSDGGSVTNSPAKRSIGGSTSQTREPKRTLIQAITGMFGRGTTPDSRSKSPDCKSTESERKSRSDSFMKFAKGFRSPNASQKSTPSSPEAPRADISELSMSSQSSFPNSPKHITTTNKESDNNHQRQTDQDLIFKSISIQASHPSTPPFPLSRKITLKHAHSEESLSDDVDDGEGSPETSLAFVANNIKVSEKMTADGTLVKSSLPPEILEKILRRGGKSAKRAAKIAQLKRVRKAQEIQRQLEELDVKHKDLEERGIKAEQNLRGETISNNDEEEIGNDGDLMQTWFLLLAEKNSLVRSEQELLVQAKQLELEDLSARLEVELRDHLLRDSRSLESVSREGEILDQLLEISEQRETLQSMLVRDKMRYQLEDKDIEAQMRAKGIRIRKINGN
jgi:hypothetical protein